MSYSFDDGLVSEKYNRRGAFHDVNTNTYYFSSANGVTYFRPTKNELRDDETQLLLHKVEVGQQAKLSHEMWNEESKRFELTFSENFEDKYLKVYVGSSNLISPEKQSIKWKLEGRDTTWTTGFDHVILIDGLLSGKYQLKIQSADASSSYGETIDIAINIKARLFNTVSVSMIFVLLLGSFIFFHIRDKKKKKYSQSNLTAEKAKDIIRKLELIMEQEKLYLDAQLTVNHLAESIEVPSGIVSQVFNDYMKIRFFDFANKYRVSEFIKCLQNGDNEQMTMEALAETCGFSSKSSFFRSFKEITGSTPARYARELKKKREPKS
ncbi:helix-turn-helix domain-containing protein [Puteibacter caeruleilacunae]|nr:helix-turn-helix domain-containing protein [Puteibacter caeruleilacunae]